jgi:hypothetical protein
VSSRQQAGPIRFDAPISRIDTATVIRLPESASRALPSRGQVAVLGSFDGVPFQAVLEPDGDAGHWMRVPDSLRRDGGLEAGAVVTLDITVTKDWPEPTVPDDLGRALASAPTVTQEHWHDITPMARWEWVRWVNATKNVETRRRRVEVGLSKLDSGKRRPCCFDLSACTDPELSKNGRLRDPESGRA